jgi:DNA (cytosine-5)-methyltransferase 1
MASGQANEEIRVDGGAPTLTCLHEAPIAVQALHPEVAPVCGTLSDGAHHGGGLNGQDAHTGRILPVQFPRDEMAVRRLTPRECERLMGFPDDFTLVPYKGKPAHDGGRYKALGNSIAVNCLRWVGQRIDLVDKTWGVP